MASLTDLLQDQGPSLERRVLAGTGMQLAARLATAACSAFAFVLIGRRLSDEGFGTFAFHFNLFLVAGALVDLGSNAIAIRESSRRPEQEEAILRAVFRLRLRTITAAVLLLLLIALVAEGGWRGAALPVFAACHLFAIAPATAGIWLLTRVQLFWVSLSSVLGQGLHLLTCLVLVRAGVTEPGAYLLSFGAGVALTSLIPFLAARRHVKLARPVEPQLVRELFIAMVPLGISAAVSTLYFRQDTFLLRKLIGVEAVGVYQRTFPLLSFSLVLPTFLSSALMPALTRAAVRGTGELLALVRRTGVVLAACVLPAAAMAFTWGPQVLWVLWHKRDLAEGATRGAAFRFGDFPLSEFMQEQGDAIRCIAPLAIAAVAIFLTYPQMHALTALGRQRVLARVAVGALAGKFLLAWVAISQWGIPGAALATMATEVGVFVWVSSELARATGGCVVSRGLARPLLVALVAGAVAAGAPRLAPGLVLGAAALLATGALFAAGALPLKLGIDR